MFSNGPMIKQEDIELLLNIHRYKRPKGSRTEQAFVEAFLIPLGVKADTWGNLHCIIGDKPNVLWSCHTDTVHNNDGFQQLHISSSNFLSLSKKSDSNCLGADDGAGIFIMMGMIKAKVPGHYIFHYGEEKGCEGSTNIATKNPEILKDIDIALAFDRRDCWDVITRINGSTVCSDDFAESLVKQLPVGYRIGAYGMRTDVKLYEKLVAECCNISVGYSDPHLKTEKLDMMHLIKLRDAMLKIDSSKLKIKRDPTKVEPANNYNAHGYSRGHHNSSYVYNDGMAGNKYRPKTIHDIVKNSSVLIADLMEAAGVNLDKLQHLILEEQVKSKKAYNYTDFKELVPDPKWVSPYAKQNPEPSKGTDEKTLDQSALIAETVTPGNNGSDTGEVPCRGGGAPPSNVIDLVGKSNQSDKSKIGAE